MSRFLPGYDGSAHLRFPCRGALYMRPDRTAGTWGLAEIAGMLGRPYRPPLRPCLVGADTHIGPSALRSSPGGCGGWARAHMQCAPSVSKKSFRHAGRIFKLSKKFKNTCRLNAKGAFCPLHTSPAALPQTSSARFFDSLQYALWKCVLAICFMTSYRYTASGSF